MRKTAALLLITFGALTLPNDARSQVVDLSGKMTGVKNQGRRGTCSAFAATALMEFLVKEETGRTVNLSESYNYYTGKRVAAADNHLRRIYLHTDGLPGFVAVKAYEHGSMSESDWPYDPIHPKDAGDPRCAERTGHRLSTMCFTGRPPEGTSDAGYRIVTEFVERAEIGQFILRERKPVIMNVLWCEPCVNRTTGRVRMPTADEVAKARARPDSGHVIALVGYDARSRRFRFRNSRGPNWGENGYGTIPERYIVELCEVCHALTRAPDRRTEAGRFLDDVSKGVTGTFAWSPGGRP